MNIFMVKLVVAEKLMKNDTLSFSGEDSCKVVKRNLEFEKESFQGFEVEKENREFRKGMSKNKENKDDDNQTLLKGNFFHAVVNYCYSYIAVLCYFMLLSFLSCGSACTLIYMF